MRKFRLDGIYRLSRALTPLKDIQNTSERLDVYVRLIMASTELTPFMEGWFHYLGAAQEPGKNLQEQVKDAEATLKDHLEPGQLGANWAVLGIRNLVTTFETVLEQESPRMNTYVVERVGGYDMQSLIEDATVNIPNELAGEMPDQALKDYKEAGRCLAFDLFTACGFHLFRSFEGVVTSYHDLFTGNRIAEKERNWGEIEKRLKKEDPPAPERLTSLLDHLREQDRNPLIHPERTLSSAEAITAFNLTGGSIMEFAKAIKDLKAARPAPAAPAAQ